MQVSGSRVADRYNAQLRRGHSAAPSHCRRGGGSRYCGDCRRERFVPLVKVRGLRPIDQQAEQLGPAVVAARVHGACAVDQGEVEIGDHFAFAGRIGSPRLAVGFTMAVKQPPEIGPIGAARILHDLGLLIGVEPRRRADDEAGRFQGVLTDGDFRLLGEQRAEADPGHIAEWICSPSAIIA